MSESLLAAELDCVVAPAVSPLTPDRSVRLSGGDTPIHRGRAGRHRQRLRGAALGFVWLSPARGVLS